MMKDNFFIHWLIQILVVIAISRIINLSILELSKYIKCIKWIHKNYNYVTTNCLFDCPFFHYYQ